MNQQRSRKLLRLSRRSGREDDEAAEGEDDQQEQSGRDSPLGFEVTEGDAEREEEEAATAEREYGFGSLEDESEEAAVQEIAMKLRDSRKTSSSDPYAHIYQRYESGRELAGLFYEDSEEQDEDESAPRDANAENESETAPMELDTDQGDLNQHASNDAADDHDDNDSEAQRQARRAEEDRAVAERIFLAMERLQSENNDTPQHVLDHLQQSRLNLEEQEQAQAHEQEQEQAQAQEEEEHVPEPLPVENPEEDLPRRKRKRSQPMAQAESEPELEPELEQQDLHELHASKRPRQLSPERQPFHDPEAEQSAEPEAPAAMDETDDVEIQHMQADEQQAEIMNMILDERIRDIHANLGVGSRSSRGRGRGGGGRGRGSAGPREEKKKKPAQDRLPGRPLQNINWERFLTDDERDSRMPDFCPPCEYAMGTMELDGAKDLQDIVNNYIQSYNERGRVKSAQEARERWNETLRKLVQEEEFYDLPWCINVVDEHFHDHVNCAAVSSGEDLTTVKMIMRTLHQTMLVPDSVDASIRVVDPKKALLWKHMRVIKKEVQSEIAALSATKD